MSSVPQDGEQARFTPQEDALTKALVDVKTANPRLGISKVHAEVLKNHPEWLVSEKRTRKILQNHGLIVASTPSANDTEQPIFPSSRVIEGLDVFQWTAKVEVKYFDKKKGKGLVAIEDINERDVIWREDPFIIAPEWYGRIFYLQPLTIHILSLERLGKSLICK